MQTAQQPKYGISMYGIAPIDATGFTAPEYVTELGSATFVGGALSVPEGAHAHILIRTLAKASAVDALTINVAAGATLALDLATLTDMQFVRTITMRIAPAARVVVLQETLGKGEQSIDAMITVGERAELMWIGVYREGKGVRAHTSIAQDMESGAHVVDFLLPSDVTQLDVQSRSTLTGAHARADVRALGFLDGASRSFYRGHVDLTSTARGAAGSQDAKFILLSPNAKLDAQPYLDIAHNDVQCAHRLAIAPLTPATLFYPALRGMDSTLARTLYLSGLIEAELSCIKHPDILKDLRAALVAYTL